MISHRQILRMVDAGQSARLVERILLNGRCADQCVMAMLCHPGIAAPVAMGLAIQRVNELCYGASELGTDLARRLVTLQNGDGSFGNLRCTPIGLRLGATAVAIRGWLTWRDGHFSITHEAVGQAILDGVAGGLEWVRDAHCDGQSIIEHSAAWAIVLWQLGDRDEFRQLVPVHELLERLDATPHSQLLDGLFAYARAMAA